MRRPSARHEVEVEVEVGVEVEVEVEVGVAVEVEEEAGSVSLNREIFGLEPRPDLIQRCIVWQLAKRRAGTHKVKNRAEINRTGKKAHAQKGTGGARHGSMRANLFRGGGRSFGIARAGIQQLRRQGSRYRVDAGAE